MRRIALVLITAALFTIGCGPSEPRADLIFVTADEHNSLDPQKISWVVDNRIVECLFEPLLRVQPDGMTLEPGVAQRWQVSDDGLTYTFYLRQDAAWSNGDPVTAKDFIYAWRRALLPDLASDYTQLLFCIAGAEDFFQWRSHQLKTYQPQDGDQDTAGNLWEKTVEQFEQTVGVKADGDNILTVQLLRRTPYFLDLVAFATFMPVHAASVSRAVKLSAKSGMVQQDVRYWSDPTRLVSNGAYILKRRRFKRDLLMVASGRYWNRAHVKNSRILEKIISEPQTALLAYENGQVNWLADLPTSSQFAANLIAQNRSDVHVQSMAGVYFYNFNCSDKLPDGSDNHLADMRVRQALSMAIDRQAIVQRVTRLNQTIARSFVPPGVVEGYDPPVDAGIGFDKVRARKMLAEAGYPDGKGLTGLSILYNTSFGHENIAQAIVRMWEQYLGVTVVLEGIEKRAFNQRLRKHQFTICRASWFGDYQDPTTWLDKMTTGNGNNDCAYSNKAYDALMSKAGMTADSAARFAVLRQAESLMLSESPMAMIFQSKNISVFDPDLIEGLEPNAWARTRLDQVRIKH